MFGESWGSVPISMGRLLVASVHTKFVHFQVWYNGKYLAMVILLHVEYLGKVHLLSYQIFQSKE